MPDTQPLSTKKYAVVTFIDEDSVEVIPSNWIINQTEMKWPNISSRGTISKYIKDCAPVSRDWTSVNIKINSFSNSFSKARRKASAALETSHLSSDSSDEDASLKRPRKKQKPLRFQTDSSDAESDSIITGKKYNIPSLPKSCEVDVSTPKIASQSQSQLLNMDHFQKDPTPTALFSRVFQYLEKNNNKMRDLSSKVDRLIVQVEKITNSTSTGPMFHYLPDDINLPVTSIDELKALNEKIRHDKEFASILVRYLFNAGSGKSMRSFVLSLTKKVLAKQVAIQFSRYGRKSKKSFMDYNETLNVILAAASMKYETDREELSEMFGKSLACATDWDRRKVRPSDCTLEFTDV